LNMGYARKVKWFQPPLGSLDGTIVFGSLKYLDKVILAANCIFTFHSYTVHT